jgi:hypothetical protein
VNFGYIKPVPFQSKLCWKIYVVENYMINVSNKYPIIEISIIHTCDILQMTFIDALKTSLHINKN